MARKLSEEFINELKEGKFRPVLQAVLDDDSLDLELRGDCVIIYYRGGKLLTLNSNGTFEALDSNYHESTTFLNIVPSSTIGFITSLISSNNPFSIYDSADKPSNIITSGPFPAIISVFKVLSASD